MSLLNAIESYTGLQNTLVLEFVTGLVFTVGVLLIVAIFVKFLFRLL